MPACRTRTLLAPGLRPDYRPAQRAKWSQPRAPSYASPSTVTPGRPAEQRPITVQPSGISTDAGNVATSGWSSPPVEDEPHRVDAERRPDRLHRLGELEGAVDEVDLQPAGRGDVVEVGQQPVGDVDHRVAPALAACGPAAYGGSGSW